MAVEMREAILTVLLAVMNNGAVAEWVVAGGSEIYTAYVDTATIRKVGSMVKVWELLDLQTAVQLDKGKQHMSVKRQSEYDCEQEQWRAPYLSLYAGHMATGKLVYSNANPDKWQPILPGSVGEALWQFACRKR